MKTIVVLGVGPSSSHMIRQFMVNTVLKRDDLKLIVVSPTGHFYWPIATPRLVVPGQLPEEKVIIPLESSFKDYPPSKFEFVLGAATSLDPSSNLVVVNLQSGGTQSINYDTLIIATGTRARDGMPWKALESTEKTKAKLHSLQEQVKKAKTIVVAGGGLTGVETAGELGFEYSKNGTKEIIFIHDGPLPLGPPAIDSVRKAAKNELEKLKVKVIANTQVVGSTTSGSDTVLELRDADGKTKSLTTQAYLPAIGVIPNSEFVPANLKDSDGYVKQTTTLQVEGHPNIFVIGDVGNMQECQLLYAEGQGTHLMKNLATYLSSGKMPEYTVDPKPIFTATVGRSRATGQIGTFKLFSILIWFMKGRYLGTNYSERWALGKQTMSATLEK